MKLDKYLEQTSNQEKAQEGSYIQEKGITNRFKGRLVTGSGNKIDKGDIKKAETRFGLARIEAKTTIRKSFSVTREILKKVEEAAILNNEIPVLIVEFLDTNGKPEGSLAIMDIKYLDL